MNLTILIISLVKSLNLNSSQFCRPSRCHGSGLRSGTRGPGGLAWKSQRIHHLLRRDADGCCGNAVGLEINMIHIDSPVLLIFNMNSGWAQMVQLQRSLKSHRDRKNIRKKAMTPRTFAGDFGLVLRLGVPTSNLQLPRCSLELAPP